MSYVTEIASGATVLDVADKELLALRTSGNANKALVVNSNGDGYATYNLAGKLDVAQGNENVGKVPKVNASGNLELADITITGYVAIAQGAANSNKKLVTDSSGNVVTQKIYPDWMTDRGDGSDGAFAPTSNTTIVGGEKNYTSVNIPAGVTVTFSSSVIIKCQGAFVNGGTITVTADNTNNTLNNMDYYIANPGLQSYLGIGGLGGNKGYGGGAGGDGNAVGNSSATGAGGAGGKVMPFNINIPPSTLCGGGGGQGGLYGTMPYD